MLSSLKSLALRAAQARLGVGAAEAVPQQRSEFVDACGTLASSQAFADALAARGAALRSEVVVIGGAAPATGGGAWTRGDDLAQVLVAVAALVRGGFCGTVDVAAPDCLLVAGVAPDLETGRAWQDDALRDMFLLEIDKGLRVLALRGAHVRSHLPAPTFVHRRHRNQLQNTTPFLVAIPERRATLATYSTDKPDFPGYDASYPDAIAYDFNDSGYRNDFEHDPATPHSVVLGDSFAEGVAVAYRDTVASRLMTLEGRLVFCLACHGGSISYMYRSLMNHLAQRPPMLDSVYAVFTEIHRFDVPDSHFVFANGVHTTVSSWSDAETLRYITQLGVGYAYLSAYLTHAFFKEYCAAHGHRYRPAFYSYWNPAPAYHANIYGEDVSQQLWGADFLDLGRDRLHPGRRELARLTTLLFGSAPPPSRRVRALRRSLVGFTDMLVFRMKRREYLYK